jgi:chorismate dehydratase
MTQLLQATAAASDTLRRFKVFEASDHAGTTDASRNGPNYTPCTLLCWSKPVLRLGVVSFLNAEPLIHGLATRDNLQIMLDVPSALAERLDGGEFDAALVPVFDVLRRGDAWRVVSDACIGCDGETMTVRVFSRVPPDRVRVLHADADSHTSVNLARVLWRELFDRRLEIRRLDTRVAGPAEMHDVEAVLLIGDKVVDPTRGHFGYEVDLGGAWRAHTGLPFVFAVWAARNDELRSAKGGSYGGAGAPASGRSALLCSILNGARDAGVACADALAAEFGPRHGWPVELARRYLTRCLCFTLDARMIEGANLFARLLAREGDLPDGAALSCPDVAQARAAG